MCRAFYFDYFVQVKPKKEPVKTEDVKASAVTASPKPVTSQQSKKQTIPAAAPNAALFKADSDSEDSDDLFAPKQEKLTVAPPPTAAVVETKPEV